MLEIFATDSNAAPDQKFVQVRTLETFENGCWINLIAPTELELQKVAELAAVPMEFLRYPLDEEERPRVDYDDDHDCTLILADFPYFDSDGSQNKFVTMPIGIILLKTCVITVSLHDATILETFKHGRMRNFMTQYHSRFCIQILYAGAREYLKLLRYMDKLIEETEHLLTKSISNRELFKLMQVGKSLVYFSTSLKSNQLVLQRLMSGRVFKTYEDDADLLDDTLIEYSQALEMANIYTSIINGTMDAYASVISNNLNIVMKFMAAMSIVLSVPPIFSGILGQNVTMPFHDGFLEKPWAFIFSLVLPLAAVFITIWLLRKKDMF